MTAKKQLSIILSEDQLQKMISCAVKQAFKEIGLNDEKASEDVKELRSFLEAFRSAKSVIWKTVLTLVITGMMMLLTLGGYSWINKPGG